MARTILAEQTRALLHRDTTNPQSWHGVQVGGGVMSEKLDGTYYTDEEWRAVREVHAVLMEELDRIIREQRGGLRRSDATVPSRQGRECRRGSSGRKSGQ